MTSNLKYVCMYSLMYLDGWRLAEGRRWECDVETLARIINSKLDYNRIKIAST